ncbi:MAG: hypothetical protein LBP42_05185 [Treponema sp.]|nr:hypothetical protein [Treponema sp.]
METKKNILIVTDGAESTQNIGRQIACLCKNSHVVLLEASGFCGTDLLPADVCFFGCEEPAPPSFAYLEKILGHINLVGRPCGIFSSKSKKALQYLSGMVHDAELALYDEPFIADTAADIKTWVERVISRN